MSSFQGQRSMTDEVVFKPETNPPSNRQRSGSLVLAEFCEFYSKGKIAHMNPQHVFFLDLLRLRFIVSSFINRTEIRFSSDCCQVSPPKYNTNFCYAVQLFRLNQKFIEFGDQYR
jgi:hypothetical protein